MSSLSKTLTVREDAGKILFEIEFVPPKGLAINRAHFLCNGVELVVKKSHIFIINTGNLLKFCTMDYRQIGLQLGRNMRG